MALFWVLAEVENNRLRERVFKDPLDLLNIDDAHLLRYYR